MGTLRMLRLGMMAGGIILVSGGCLPDRVTMPAAAAASAAPVARDPLLIVDGAVVSPDGFRYLDPDIVEDVHVLRPAQAVPLYGPDARNGAIAVRTKGWKGRLPLDPAAR